MAGIVLPAQVLGPWQKLIFQWPSLLCLLFLLGRYVYMIVKSVRIHLKLLAEEVRDK